MTIRHDAAPVGFDGAVVNAAAAMRPGAGDVFAWQPPLQDGKDWRCVSWGGWQQFPHPFINQPATRKDNGCGGFITDIAGMGDPFRMSRYCIWAWIYRCVYHDGTSYVLPAAPAAVARYRKTVATPVPDAAPFVTCCWDLHSSNHWELVAENEVPAGATVDLEAWPARLVEMLASDGTMMHDDNCGGQVAYGESAFVDPGASKSCVLQSIIPPYARHDLLIIAESWKRVPRKGQLNDERTDRTPVAVPPDFAPQLANVLLRVTASICDISPDCGGGGGG